MTTYTIDASGSGNYTTLTATNYREARRKAKALRNGYHSRVKAIKGTDIKYDSLGYTTNVTDVWVADGRRKWHRVQC